MVKTCTKCSENKSLDLFPKCSTNKDRKYSICKQCNSEKAKIYYKNNSEKRKSYQRLYSKNVSKVGRKNNRLKHKYGINLTQYNELLLKQNNCCAICKKEESIIDAVTNKNIKLAVDHDHATGKIRALLCGACNKAIGLLKDSSELCLAAANYLSQHKDIIE